MCDAALRADIRALRVGSLTRAVLYVQPAGVEVGELGAELGVPLYVLRGRREPAAGGARRGRGLVPVPARPGDPRLHRRRAPTAAAPHPRSRGHARGGALGRDPPRRRADRRRAPPRSHPRSSHRGRAGARRPRRAPARAKAIDQAPRSRGRRSLPASRESPPSRPADGSPGSTSSRAQSGIAVVNACCRLPRGLVARPLPELPRRAYRVLRRRDAASEGATAELRRVVLAHADTWQRPPPQEGRARA